MRNTGFYIEFRISHLHKILYSTPSGNSYKLASGFAVVSKRNTEPSPTGRYR